MELRKKFKIVAKKMKKNYDYKLLKNDKLRENYSNLKED